MAIRRSAATETQDLIETLAGGDAVVRETAAARLSAIGARVVPHLIEGFHRTSSSVARTTILKILESTHDRRGLALALDVLADSARDPAVAAAAITLLGAFLDGESTHALESLGAVAIDPDRPDLERLAAWQMLERMPERILAPLRKRLARDQNPAVRRQAGAARPAERSSQATLDPGELLESASAGQTADPAVLVAALHAAGRAAPLTTLHRLIEHARTREHQLDTAADRQEWLTLRAALHLALAERRSRVALYDARDTIQESARPLPGEFATVLARVGDASCLGVIADALARMPATGSPQEDEWRDRLLEAGRAILDRERLTRRHAVVRRLARIHPDVALALFG